MKLTTILFLLLFLIVPSFAASSFRSGSWYYEMPTRWWHRLEDMPNPRPPPRQSENPFLWVIRAEEMEAPGNYGNPRNRTSDQVSWDVYKAREILPWAASSPEIGWLLFLMLSDYNMEDRQDFITQLFQ